MGWWRHWACLMNWPDNMGLMETAGAVRCSKSPLSHVDPAKLLTNAPQCVNSLEHRAGPNDDVEHILQVLALSAKDIKKGCAEGFFTRAQMDRKFGKRGWRPMPRHAIPPGAK